MDEQSRKALTIGMGAAILGLIGDQVLRAGPWGMNAAVWIAELVLILIFFFEGFDPAGGSPPWRICSLAAAFAILFAWHDSFMLKFLLFAGVSGALLLIPMRARGLCLREESFLHYLFELFAVGLSAMIGPFFLLFKDVRWKSLPRAGRSSRFIALARGAAIALPLLIIFGALFVAADAVFEGIVKNLFDIDLAEVIGHLFFVGFIGWIAAGYLRRVFNRPEPAFEAFAPPSRPSVGIVETAVVLGSLDLLFLFFVVTQLRYLFGGAGHVMGTPDLTLAQYARRGFFELVAVAALTLPLLLGAHWLLRKDNPAHERAFRWLAGILMVLLVVVMASAANRLFLYQREFGITEDRLYAFGFMTWLAIVLAWFGWTVLRGRRDRFAFGAIASGFAAILCAQAINPDALIVRVNSMRAAEGKRFDSTYLTSLSLDAVPGLIEAMPSYQKADRRIVAAHLVGVLSVRDDGDWRTWSLAKSEALGLITANRNSLDAILAEKPEPPASGSGTHK